MIFGSYGGETGPHGVTALARRQMLVIPDPRFARADLGTLLAGGSAETGPASEPGECGASGEPVTIGGSPGLYHAGRANRAVLMLSPIGFEELCMRSSWRTLAGLFSAAGIPALRFDYPGTGDALDPDHEPTGIEDWKASVIEAAAALKHMAGVEEIILLGQGLGATLALTLAPRIAGVAAVVAMAPVENGRHYLRELGAWSRMVTDAIGIGPDPLEPNGLAVGGFTLEDGRASAIKALRLETLAAKPAAATLVVARPGSDRDQPLVTTLESLGSAVSVQPFTGYETLLTDPTQARPPIETLTAVVDWVKERVSLRFSGPRAPRPLPLAGTGFSETALRFGPGRRLYGVHCRPDGIDNPPTIVFTNAGHDYHVGWARVTVMLARVLASAGYASLRFDLDGIGESPAHPGSPDEALYSEQHIADTEAAIEQAARLSAGPLIVIGRCSGGYAALQAALRDQRVGDLIIVNTQRFIWDKDEDVATAVRYGHRSVGDFGATLLKKGTLQRLLRGELNLAQAGRYIRRSLGTRFGRTFAPYLFGLSKHSRLYRAVHRQFRALEARGARVTMLFSTDDAGLREFTAYFGARGQRLRGYERVTMRLIPDADHNFTHRGARERLRDALFETLGRIGEPR